MMRPLPAPGELSNFPFYRLRKLRLYLAWPFFIVLAVFATSSNFGFVIGIPLILLGEGVRIWSHGYLRKTRRLATSGPYAHVRNPLYLGNFLMGLGFCLVIWNPLITAVFVGGFVFVYWVTVKGEEERLAYKFEREYAEYARQVPRFIPRLSPYGGRQNGSFAFHRAWGHGELITILAILTLLLGIYLRQELYQDRNAWNGFAMILLIAEAGLFLLLVSALFARRLRRSHSVFTLRRR
jgi:hypothetical protein